MKSYKFQIKEKANSAISFVRNSNSEFGFNYMGHKAEKTLPTTNLSEKASGLLSPSEGLPLYIMHGVIIHILLV